VTTVTAVVRGVPAFPRSVIFFLVVLIFSAACRQDMQDQPKMKPFRSSPFFRDGLSSRQPVEGTVPRGFLKADSEFFTGKKAQKQLGNSGQAAPAQAAPEQTVAGPQPSRMTPSPATSGMQAAAYPDDVEIFPFPITQSVLERGKQRYEIFCSVCHGMTGDGDGIVVRRGFRRAASFNDDRLRQAPVGHFFDAITNGWGAMPSYASQIPVQDRWAIIGYIRALQLSQQNQQLQSIQPAPPGTSPSPQPGSRQK
jgi:mono/diheme cytochrome c family protein